MSPKKHIGKLVNTDIRCVVVFMQIPNRADHALVVSTDNLQPRMEAALMSIVESQEGQAEATLANVLSRRLLPDTGQNVLQALHEQNLLRAVHIDQVIMLPHPNMPFTLRHVIESMGGESPALSEQHPVVPQEKFNPHLINAEAMDAESRIGVSRNLMIEAEMLETEARAKRERAFQLNPDLRPKAASPVRVVVEASDVVAKKVPAKSRARKKAE